MYCILLLYAYVLHIVVILSHGRTALPPALPNVLSLNSESIVGYTTIQLWQRDVVLVLITLEDNVSVSWNIELYNASGN